MVQLVDEQFRLGFIVFMCGEINEGGKILNDIPSRVTNRADKERRPELAFIFAAIEDFCSAIGLALKLVLDSRQCLSIGAMSHEEIKAFCEHLFPVIPG